MDPRPPLHVLHIGKTGGTALKHALLEHLDDASHRLLLHGHDVTVEHIPRGERFMFVLRDPISRFVSAFYGRLREDRPRYHYPWTAEERFAFTHFRTPEELASSLSSPDDAQRERAQRALRGIAHAAPYSRWLGDAESFRNRLADLYFIGFQDQLDEDFELLKSKLDLPSAARLPSDPIAAHRSPLSAADELSDVARANLERRYSADVVFVGECRRLANLVNRDEAPRTHGRPRAITFSPAGRLGVRARIVTASVAGAAAFAVAAVLVDALTDRDWRLSGLEWPADFVTAVFLVCLVPLVLNASLALARIWRRGVRQLRIGDRTEG